MKTRLNQNGFTLIELLVVISIISLLVSILLPSLTRAKELASSVVCASQMRALGMAHTLYAEDFDGMYYQVSFDATSNTGAIGELQAPDYWPFWCFIRKKGYDRSVEPLTYLKYVEVSQLFCPKFSDTTYTVEEFWTYANRIGYCFFPNTYYQGNGLLPTDNQYDRLDNVAADQALAQDIMVSSPTGSDYLPHLEGGNVAFTDGHGERFGEETMQKDSDVFDRPAHPYIPGSWLMYWKRM